MDRETKFLLECILNTLKSSNNTTGPTLADVLAKLNETCAGAPINVNVCNQADFTVIELLLTNILTSVQAIDANTDTVEVNLVNILNELQQNTADNATLISSISTIISSLQQLELNTDDLEALLTTINTSIVTEGDQTQALLTSLSATQTSMLAKLNETCAGNPINVTVCNPTDLTTVQGLLNSILLSVQNIDSNTDTVEASLASLLTELQQNTTDNATIISQITSVIGELQDIDANTINLEALLTSIGTLIVSEGDQTQAILTTVDSKIAVTNTELAAINSKLNETCAGAPINVVVCNQIDLTGLQSSLNDILAELITANVSLSNIDDNTDTVETLISNLITDIQTLITETQTGNTLLTSIDTSLSTISTQLTTVISSLTSINSDTTAISNTLTTITGQLSTLQTTLQNEFDETQVILNQILNKKEFDQTTLNWLPYCVDGVDWYFTDVRIIDNDTGIETGGATATIYKQGVSGTITSTAPTGTVITEGYCNVLVTNTPAQLQPMSGGGQLEVTDSAVVTLATVVDTITTALPFGVPTGAVGARIQVKGGDIFFTDNGLTPVNTSTTVGNCVFEDGFIYLGREPRFDNDCESDLTNVQFLAVVGSSAILEITYFQIK